MNPGCYVFRLRSVSLLGVLGRGANANSKLSSVRVGEGLGNERMEWIENKIQSLIFEKMPCFQLRPNYIRTVTLAET